MLHGPASCTGLQGARSQTRTKCLGLPAVACSLGEQLTRGFQAEARRAEDRPGRARISKYVGAGAALALALLFMGTDKSQVASTALFPPEKHRSRGIAPEPSGHNKLQQCAAAGFSPPPFHLSTVMYVPCLFPQECDVTGVSWVAATGGKGPVQLSSGFGLASELISALYVINVLTLLVS